MCKSLAEGGQRCASHTRARLTKVASIVEAAVLADDGPAVFAAREEWMSAAAEYASTNEGHQHFVAQRDAAEAAGQFDTAAMLSTVVVKGDAIRAANKDAAVLISAVRMGEATTPLIPSPAEMAVSTSSAPMGVVLSDSGRQQWDDMITSLKRACEGVLTLHGGRSTESLVDAFEGIDGAAGDPSSTDGALAAAMNEYSNALANIMTRTPKFKGSEVSEWLRTPEVRDAYYRASAAWQDFYQKMWATRSFQNERIMNHPNIGEQTYRGLYKHENMRRKMTARSNFPTRLLNEAMREDSDPGGESDTSVHPDGWARARQERMVTTTVALTLAAKDPDSWQRQEAVNQVVMTPLEDFSEQDRAWMAGNLHQIPGAANQKVLAQGLVDYAKSYADDAEKQRLAKILTGVNTVEGSASVPRDSPLSPEIRQIGAAIGSVADLTREEPKKKRWFANP